jgi:shikimate kinase
VKRHVALTGFMAAGKSTIGKRLARKMNVAFYDVDELIVREHGPVAGIFYQLGELQFRRHEFETIRQIIEGQEPGIIALGGGADTYDESLKMLKKRTYRVFVKASPEQILSRLRRSSVIRPMLGPQPTLATVKDLYARRMPHYSHADLVVDAQKAGTSQIVDHIMQWLNRKSVFQ